MRLWVSLVVFALGIICRAEEQANYRKGTTDPEHRQMCQQNLTRIFDALGQYVARYGALPNWVSDLVPEFISDRAVLVCPYVAKTGQFLEWRKGLVQGPGKPGKGPPTYYHYEFCLEKAPHVLPEDSDKTYRDYKQAQRFLLGDAVPIVRCLAHEPVLNLAYNGLIFENIDPVYWEESFAHIYPHRSLAPRDIFPITRQIGASGAHVAASGSATLLDLCEHFNIVLHNLPSTDRTNNLAGLPRGVQRFGGVDFNISGVLHLTRGSQNLPFPREAPGIVVNQRCSKIHFLHGFVSSDTPSPQVARIAVHFAEAGSLTDPVTVPMPGTNNGVAWQATLQERGLKDRTVVVYRTTWDNPEPSRGIATLSFVSAMTEAAPFLLGVTLE
jgi:hypothetical protein